MVFQHTLIDRAAATAFFASAPTSFAESRIEGGISCPIPGTDGDHSVWCAAMYDRAVDLAAIVAVVVAELCSAAPEAFDLPASGIRLNL